MHKINPNQKNQPIKIRRKWAFALLLLLLLFYFFYFFFYNFNIQQNISYLKLFRKMPKKKFLELELHVKYSSSQNSSSTWISFRKMPKKKFLELELHVKYSSSQNSSSLKKFKWNSSSMNSSTLHGTQVPEIYLFITRCSKNRVSKQGHFPN